MAEETGVYAPSIERHFVGHALTQLEHCTHMKGLISHFLDALSTFMQLHGQAF